MPGQGVKRKPRLKLSRFPPQDFEAHVRRAGDGDGAAHVLFRRRRLGEKVMIRARAAEIDRAVSVPVEAVVDVLIGIVPRRLIPGNEHRVEEAMRGRRGGVAMLRHQERQVEIGVGVEIRQGLHVDDVHFARYLRLQRLLAVEREHVGEIAARPRTRQEDHLVAEPGQRPAEVPDHPLRSAIGEHGNDGVMDEENAHGRQALPGSHARRIVRALAGDRDVVDVAFAQAAPR